MEVFQLKNLSFTYPEEEKKVLKNLSLTIESGDFLVLSGASGSGKTTLLRMLKKELTPYGKQNGTILYRGKSLDQWSEALLSKEIGFLFQDPDNQIVMDEVYEEIVFGMENLNIPPIEMKKRVAELVHFFGVQALLKQKTSELSGGQKQLVNLLSILLLRPKVLLLDEPTSQLDPVAARELLQILDRLNKEMGMTIVLVEHRLEELFSIANKVIMLHDGEVVYEGTSREVVYNVFQKKDEHFISYIPSVSQLYLSKESKINQEMIPLNVNESRRWLQSKKFTKLSDRPDQENLEKNSILTMNRTYFQYEKDAPFVIKNCTLTLKEGEFFSLIGGNGSGKSTLLRLCMGILKQQRGKILYEGKKLKKYKQEELINAFAYLPQHPLAFYIKDTIDKEMNAIIQKHHITNGDAKKKQLSSRLQIEHILQRHPNDLSGGELQRATLACLLLQSPKVLFIDEPTKGLDPISKEHLASLLLELQEEGLTIFMVTHDIEFAVQYSDRCGILFDGNIAALGTPEQLFKGNYFYTTTINRATMGREDLEVLTLEEALAKWQKVDI